MLLLMTANVCIGSVNIPFAEVLRILGGERGADVSADIVPVSYTHLVWAAALILAAAAAVCLVKKRKKES